MRIGQAQDLPLQGWCRRASVGATLVVARCVENTAHGHLLGGGQQLPHVENPLRGRLPGAGIRAAACGNAGFQWAPTLGGECYFAVDAAKPRGGGVSMGTHPWG